MSPEPGKREDDKKFEAAELEQWADDGGAVYETDLGPEVQPELDIPEVWDNDEPEKGLR